MAREWFTKVGGCNFNEVILPLKNKRILLAEGCLSWNDSKK